MVYHGSTAIWFRDKPMVWMASAYLVLIWGCLERVMVLVVHVMGASHNVWSVPDSAGWHCWEKTMVGCLQTLLWYDGQGV